MTTKAQRTKAAKDAAEVEDVVDVEAEPVVIEALDSEIVEMWHPETPGNETSAVTRGAYREVWAVKGWRIVKSRSFDGSKLTFTLEPKLGEDEMGVPEEGVVTQDSTTVEGSADASSSAGSDAGSSS